MNDKILKNYNLIYRVMNDLHCSRDEEEQDEFQFAGLLGLINGIQTYKECSTKESTYYYTCIKNSIITRFSKREREKNNYNSNIISLSTPLNSTHCIEDNLTSEINVEKQVIDKIMYEKIVDIIDTRLKNKTKTYIKEYYGINQPKKNLRQISKLHNVSKQNVDQIIKNGIKKIKQELKKGDD